MGYDQIVSLIGAVGFPIVACGALFWFMNNTLKEMRESLDKMTKAILRMTGGRDSDD